MLVVLIALFKLFQEQRQHCVYYSIVCGGVSIGQFFSCANFLNTRNTWGGSFIHCRMGTVGGKICCAKKIDLRNTWGWLLQLSKGATAKTVGLQYGYFITRVAICSPPPCQKSEYKTQDHRQKNTTVAPEPCGFNPLLAQRPPFYSRVSS